MRAARNANGEPRSTPQERNSDEPSAPSGVRPARVELPVVLVRFPTIVSALAARLDARAVISVHTACYPLVLLYFSPEKHREADWRALFEKNDQIARRALESGSHYATIAVVDATVTAAERKLIAQLAEATPLDLRTRVVGSYVVGLPGPIRTILVGLRWLAPNLVQTEPASTVDEAIASAVTALSGRAIRVHDDVRKEARRWLDGCRG